MTKIFDPAHAAANGYTRDDWDAVDSPELTTDDIARLKPMREALPDLYAALQATLRSQSGEKATQPSGAPDENDAAGA